ncbi:MAG: hypothetical protein M3463_12135 [Verrucomicrobiota bacterium]|nr:hypothetical protein [Verrucomicrobiota bacterium]
MKTLVWSLAGLLAMGAPSVHGEEKNGLSLSVSRKTLERADSRRTYYGYDRIDRTQGLKATIKNVSFKPMPAGEVEWTLLVRKHNSTFIERFTGKEKLQALKPAETAELVLGAAQITGYRDWYDQAKDKLEYRVIVNQGGKETIRTTSTSAFDAVAKRAQIKTVAPDAGAK